MTPVTTKFSTFDSEFGCFPVGMTPLFFFSFRYIFPDVLSKSRPVTPLRPIAGLRPFYANRNREQL